VQEEEPKELDSDIDAVANMQNGIKRILSEQPRTKPRKVLRVPENERHILHCARILKVESGPRVAVIIVEKKEGGLRQIRVEASDD
jgi:hypothetical protein